MKELLSYLFPFFVVCLILFVVTRIWVALVDTVIGWGKRLLHLEGGNKVAVKWHITRPAIPAEETEQMSECKEKSDAKAGRTEKTGRIRHYINIYPDYRSKMETANQIANVLLLFGFKIDEGLSKRKPLGYVHNAVVFIFHLCLQAHNIASLQNPSFHSLLQPFFFEMPKIDAKKQQIFFKTYCLCADVIGNSYLAVRDGDRKICFFKV